MRCALSYRWISIWNRFKVIRFAYVSNWITYWVCSRIHPPQVIAALQQSPTGILLQVCLKNLFRKHFCYYIWIFSIMNLMYSILRKMTFYSQIICIINLHLCIKIRSRRRTGLLPAHAAAEGGGDCGWDRRSAVATGVYAQREHEGGARLGIRKVRTILHIFFLKLFLLFVIMFAWMNACISVFVFPLWQCHVTQTQHTS